MQKNDKCQRGNRADLEQSQVGKSQAMARKVYERRYEGLRCDLPDAVRVTVLTVTGERSDVALGLWDTGSSSTSISKRFADRLGIVPMPPMGDDGELITTANIRYLGTATASLQIGDIFIPYKTVKVMDFDPEDIHWNAGETLPDILIGMDIICLGRFEVDSTSGNTVLKFEMP